MLTITGLDFGYSPKQHQIDHLDLQLQAGDLLGLLGPNGAGKTTLVSLIAGLLEPRGGRIDIDGQPARLGRRELALVPQEYAFYPRLTGRENLDYFAGVLSLGAAQRRRAVADALQQCDLTRVQHQRAGNYSGGIKRRLNFAIALLQRPALLILDEPTANVDPQSRAFLLDTVRRLNREGTTVIYASHLLEEVESLCHSLALLDNGKLVASGPLSELLGRQRRHLVIKTPALPRELAQMPGTHQREDGCWVLDPESAGLSSAEILLRLGQAGIDPEQLQYGHSRLEELFFAATRRELRD